ncbi:MAG: ribonuclease III [Lachnospiraceae bacterium]|uniref:Mini-ribonuclease 3 n=1 Tax=Candidatus Weimeria bifida TaxID=2599074 RepID=A0A6N7IZ17_9FIRM|nr:ribonuclease III [Candidatus Weimeria bifida]RRF97061.1 MAG: ribonuclease III [Lachnospiraceae bacterium]
MEESISAIRSTFGIAERDIRTYSPLTLAFLGDGVFEIVIRSIVVAGRNVSPSRLHNASAHIVKAESQRKITEAIEPLLSDDEADILRRGRNAKSYTHSKNASVSDYRMATGFEALLGYLYLLGKDERILFLIKQGLELTGLFKDHTGEFEEINHA